ncbi:hypothetical protein ACQ4LK_24530, partial [Bacillus pumilus]
TPPPTPPPPPPRPPPAPAPPPHFFTPTTRKSRSCRGSRGLGDVYKIQQNIHMDLRIKVYLFLV